jgi:hypothetical protein
LIFAHLEIRAIEYWDCAQADRLSEKQPALLSGLAWSAPTLAVIQTEKKTSPKTRQLSNFLLKWLEALVFR